MSQRRIYCSSVLKTCWNFKLLNDLIQVWFESSTSGEIDSPTSCHYTANAGRLYMSYATAFFIQPRLNCDSLQRATYTQRLPILWPYTTRTFRVVYRFLGKTYVMTGVRRRRRRSYKVRQSYISGTVLPRITKFYRHIHAGLPIICTGHNVTNYFRSKATAKKNSPTCRIRRLEVEFLEKRSCEDHQISRG